MSGIVKTVSRGIRSVGRVARKVVENPFVVARFLGENPITKATIGGLKQTNIPLNLIGGIAGALGGGGGGSTSGNALGAAAESIGAVPLSRSELSLPRPQASSTGATAPSAASAPSAPRAQPFFAPSPAQHITVNAPIAPTPPVQLPQIQANAPSIAGQRSRVGSAAGVHTSSGGAAPPSISGLTGTGSAIVSNRRRRSRVI